MKDIVFCADGTWDHPHQETDGVSSDTNVRKFYKALVTDEHEFPIYDDGVGAHGNPWEHFLGGAFGEGLLAKIKDGYQQIAAAYQPSDRIHIFGFSRGAYTARSLAGMIADCGLPKNTSALQNVTDAAFNVYRERKAHRDAVRTFIAKFDQQEVTIATVGVWDTVGALGIPVKIFEGIDEAIYGFLDTALHPDIQAAYHAVSIDELRPEFEPTLWKSVPIPGQILAQIWFAGVHGDVGGGYPDCGLSNITLHWMIQKAMARGLQFQSEVISALSVSAANAMAMLHHSWTPLFGEKTRRVIPPDAIYASTVRSRYLDDPTYRPPNLVPGFPSSLPNTCFFNVLA